MAPDVVSPLLLLALAIGGALALSWAVALERRGRTEVLIGVVLALVVIESLLFGSQNSVPAGVFKPAFGAMSFRLPELLIGLGLVARVVVRGLPSRITTTGAAWILFSIWYATAAVLGYLMGNHVPEVLVQAKAIIYLAGAYVLVGAIPVHRLISHSMRRWLLILAPVVAVMIPLSLSDTTIPLSLPFLRAPYFGGIGGDAGSLLVAVATVGLLVEASRRRRRPVVALAGLVLLVAPLASTQRAAVIGLAASSVVVVLATLTPAWRRNISVTATTIGLGVTALVAVGLATSLFQVAEGDRPPGAQVYEELFQATRKQQSAETRMLQWEEGQRLVSERPILGWGLGKRFSTFHPGLGEFRTGAGFHNVQIDLLVRSGIPGLALFAIAVALSLRDAWRVWQDHLDPRVAAFAMACGAALVGLLVKAQVESLLEKFRLAVIVGLLLGGIASAAASEVGRRREVSYPVPDQVAAGG